MTLILGGVKLARFGNGGRACLRSQAAVPLFFFHKNNRQH